MYRISKGFLLKEHRSQMSVKNHSTLRQIYVVFRHGDRTPDKVSMYPKDPHLKDPWYPYGLGALTNIGKLEMYNVGRELRNRYDSFLGSLYLPEMMEAFSTDFDRTKISLLLVLAGLWPPNPIQKWNENLPWQPIPYKSGMHLLNLPLMHNENYRSSYNKVIESDFVQNFLNTNSNRIKYINDNSGLNIKIPLDLFVLYFGLYAEEKTGRILPEWTKEIYPEFMEESTKFEYKIQVYSKEMQKMAGGRFLKYLIENSMEKMNEKFGSKSKKLFLFSGHEYNIVYVLSALKLYEPHIPKYASYVAIELHELNREYGFKILYQDYTDDKPRTLLFKGTNEFCTFVELLTETKDVFPDDEIVL